MGLLCSVEVEPNNTSKYNSYSQKKQLDKKQITNNDDWTIITYTRVYYNGFEAIHNNNKVIDIDGKEHDNLIVWQSFIRDKINSTV